MRCVIDEGLVRFFPTTLAAGNFVDLSSGSLFYCIEVLMVEK